VVLTQIGGSPYAAGGQPALAAAGSLAALAAAVEASSWGDTDNIAVPVAAAAAYYFGFGNGSGKW
jgi:dolichol kinase